VSHLVRSTAKIRVNSVISDDQEAKYKESSNERIEQLTKIAKNK